MRRLKNLIERAYREGEKLLGLSVWGTDQAGPFQTIPYPGSSWQVQGKPARQPHQHIRNGTAKLMTLFEPATGEVRVKGVRSCSNAVCSTPGSKSTLRPSLKLCRHHNCSAPRGIEPCGEAGRRGLRCESDAARG